MMTSNEKTTILIIQGSFQTPLPYESLLKGLQAKGYPTIHPPLPSCSNIDSPDFPTISLADDASAIRKELERLIEKENKTVFVVMHSYGGIVGTEAIPEELSYAKRHEQSLPGGVIHLFFFSAFLLAEGQSVLSAFGESPNNDVKENGTFTIKNGAKTLYSDLPDSEAAYWESQLIPQPHAVQTTILTRASYRYIPSTYLVCENDQAAPPQFQEMFAASAKAHVEKCSSGHSPMLSQPVQLVDKIVGAVEKAVEEKGQ